MQNKYIFILTISLVCSILLSLLYTFYYEKIDSNEKLDIKKNILICTSLSKEEISLMSQEEIDKAYNERIEEIVIYIEGDFYRIIDDIKVTDLIVNDDPKTGIRTYINQNDLNSKGEYLPIYKSSNSGNLENLIFPISGKGLWSTLYGYFAIDAINYNTVKAITFYKHKETPGLGGEVDSEWFQNQFTDNVKNIFNSKQELQSISIIKNANLASDNEVDAISGATITSVGLNNFLLRDLNRYKSYLLINHQGYNNE